MIPHVSDSNPCPFCVESIKSSQNEIFGPNKNCGFSAKRLTYSPAAMWKLVAAPTGWPDAQPPELSIPFPKDTDTLVIGTPLYVVSLCCLLPSASIALM